MRGKCDWLQPIPGGGWGDLLEKSTSSCRNAQLFGSYCGPQLSGLHLPGRPVKTRRPNKQTIQEIEGKLWTCAKW